MSLYSSSGDTDLLLIIPPDFFTIPPLDDHFERSSIETVVCNLSQQLEHLEERLSVVEFNCTVSSIEDMNQSPWKRDSLLKGKEATSSPKFLQKEGDDECSSKNDGSFLSLSPVKSRDSILKSDGAKLLEDMEKATERMKEKFKSNEVALTGEIKEKEGRGRRNLDFERVSFEEKFTSLSKVFSESDNNLNEETLAHKLKAETFRRRHCEEMIRELQRNLLRERENLAVAKEVDEEKDRLIEKLQKSWTTLNTHWRQLEEQRHDLAQVVQKERNEYAKKIETMESRIGELISLAANYKNRCLSLEKTNEEKDAQMNSLKVSEGENKRELDDLREILSHEKTKYRVLEECKLELERKCCVLQNENGKITELLQEKMDLAEALKTEMAQMKRDYDRIVNSQFQIEKELSVTKAEAAKTKSGLKEYYQSQMDALVKDKLSEFQRQLDDAANNLRQDLYKRERSIHDKYLAQLQQLKETHKSELTSLEKHFTMQAARCSKQLMEKEERIGELEGALRRRENEAKLHIARKVQTLMQTQWTDALRIISNEGADSDCTDQKQRPSFSPPPLPDKLQDLSTEEPGNIGMDLKKYIQMLLEKIPGEDEKFYAYEED